MNTVLDYYKEYMPDSSVQRISQNDFTACGSLKSRFSTGISVVFFYVPICRFCQEFAPELSNFSDNYASKLNSRVLAVDLSTVENKRLVSLSSNFSYTLGQVYPTVIIFYNGNPCSSYTGPRQAKYLAEFISRQSPKECEFKFVPCE